LNIDMNTRRRRTSYRNATNWRFKMTAQKLMTILDRAAMTVAVLLASLPLLTVAAGASIL